MTPLNPLTPLISAFTLETIVAYKQYKQLCLQHSVALLELPETVAANSAAIAAVVAFSVPAAVPSPVQADVEPRAKVLQLASRVEVEVFLDGVEVMDSTWDVWEDTLAEYAIAA